MFGKLLIANRGEIACRVIATARRLGIRTVAVYSDADRDARHVRLADEAQRVGPAPPRESYLDGAAILRAACAAGAEAIHPGYGFLAENAAFARACREAGFVFVGPTPEAIAAMGDKSAAKALMDKAGVPLVPGYHGVDQDADRLAQEATHIGYPVLIKPSAGGGGKGMHVVRAGEDFPRALEAAQREAHSAFGDARVLIERYLEQPRHIEIQVFGDAYGELVHLFERDCSVQRRHQKVLEEAPAPDMPAARRQAMGAAALAAARAIDYVGAGTVEFIVSPDWHFYFMEMNTRLQVEHPVTEMVTGLDLVEWQLRVAAGERLPLAQEALHLSGHAIEARVYAEDPGRDFLPATGRIEHLALPPVSATVRVDTGIETGAVISPHYDPMIAKLVVWGENRTSALARLRAALAEFEIAGLANNVAFLRRLAASRAYTAAELDTGLIERNRDALLPRTSSAGAPELATAALAELRLEQAAARIYAHTSGDPHSPWHAVDGWRLNQDSVHRFVFSEGESRHVVSVAFRADGTRLRLGRDELELAGEPLDDGSLLVHLDGRAFKARAVRVDATWHVFIEGREHKLALHRELEGLDKELSTGTLAAPMPGKVVAVLVQAGARVTKGAPLVILEAMKMEHTVTAPDDGTVEEVLFAPGDQVAEGIELLRFVAA